MDAFNNRCLELARHLASGYSRGDPPFEFADLSGRYNVREVRERVLDRDAQLLSSDGGFVIEVNTSLSAARRRMSIAHEFGHLIIREVENDGSRCHHSHLAVERLCNELAGEILCPEESLLRYFGKQNSLGNWHSPIRCQSVIEAARDFSVSVDLIARRVFLDLRLVPSAIALVWRYTENRKSKKSGSALRVASAWHNLGESTFIPLNKTAPLDSVIVKAFEHNGSFRRFESMKLGSIKGSFEVEAVGFMSFPMRSMAPPQRAVLSLLR